MSISFQRKLAATTKSVELLRFLSKSSSMGVRCLVAGNPHTSVPVLKELSKDYTFTVRWCVPAEIREKP